MNSRFSRRLFLRHAGALSSIAGSAAPFALNLSLMSSASAFSASDYKALVCISLRGGNDAFNTVLATDSASWAAYAATRGQDGKSIGLLPPGTAPKSSAAACTPARLGGVLPIRPARNQGRAFAIHPLLESVQRLFNTEQRAAIVANVGPLIVPTTKANFSRGDFPLPPQLFSHNDQTYMWQAMAPEGALYGWGGRMGDIMAAANGHAMFTAITVGGQPVWTTGESIQPVHVTSAGSLPFGFDRGGGLYGSSAAGAALRRIGSSARSSNALELDHSAVVGRSLDMHATLAEAMPPVSDRRWAGTGTAGTGASLQFIDPVNRRATLNPLAEQLQTVARLVHVARSGGLSVRRQVFFVELGTFDTHDTQNVHHAQLLAQLAHGIDYFDTTLGNLGARDAVTVMTQSEFGRSFTSNGDGTDHGWGAHHFVIGGAVRGGDIYGRFPVLGRKNGANNRFDSSPDQLHNGVLLPAVAVEQLAATLGRWLGLSETELADVLPRLREFSPSNVGLFG
jgi:uncharacterized protein (DUF1501 family)